LELIKKLVDQGKTVKEISIESGYSEGTIRKHIKELNLTVFSKKAKITQDTIDKIIKLNKDGFTNKQIGKQLGMNAATVRCYLSKNNLEFCSERTKRITNKDIHLTEEQLEILYGSLLGDASISINWKNARISFNQGGGQEEYFDYKCSFFKDYLGKICKKPRYDKRTNKYYNRFSVRLLSHPFFTKLYNLCYQNGIKTIIQEWLNHITPRGLAFWFMDDGTYDGTLATNCFYLKKYF
jgi:DNA-binding CsgD family transcriptional regulator